MPHSFAWVCKDIVKKLQGKDLKPVKRLSDAMKFHQFEILQKNPQSLFWKSEDTPVGYSLLQILEPNCPVPEPEVSSPIPLKHTLSWKLKANTGVNAAIVEGSASTGFGQSCGYDIEVQCTSIPDSKLESLQNRKLLDREPSFVKDCRMGIKDLYVVTEAFEVTKDAVLEDSSSVDLSGKVGIPHQIVKGEVKGEWQRERTDSVAILKGSVVAYKKKQLVIENNTCAILLSANAKKKTFLGMLHMHPRLKSGFAGSEWSCKSSEEIFEIVPYSGGHLDFNCLQDEISRKTGELSMLSKDVQDVVFSSLLPMLSDRKILYDLMNMLELDHLGQMDGPGGVILDALRQDSRPPWIDLKNLILYLLQALMVLSDTQLSLLVQSMEKRLLLQQQELVKSILQPNFKYPWNIPFTLQPQLLAPLQGEDLAITYELLKECGLKMELNNPRSTWDLEAKMPLSALYGSLSFLQQLVEA
ncbi:gasdermin-C-like [Peromyscus californicus insignis]|uniref:gasdermin-C-like n=1 Tax=Peromyscus californicus insignis TaxID=564181 RepID=UPI0022A778A4|nr:gasdermin-C-like [Peromyscus californicus insignis]